jgi:nicotinic acid mononucleotide adenylyltransferase
LPIGIGCTASLASDRPKRGAHRIHVAAQTADATITHSLELLKDRRSRADEEQIAATLVLNLIAEAFGIEARLPLALLDGEHVESKRTIAPPGWRDLLTGHTSAVVSELHSSTKPRLVFPGAFNPLHLGHLRMAQLAADRYGAPAEFEISIANVDKLGLDYTEMERRAVQFSQRHLPLWFTYAPTFTEKAKLFPHCIFIVGADTIERIAHCKYYDHDAAKADAAIAAIADRDCRFLVFGRQTAGGFQTLAQLDLPAALRKLCDEVPATTFREDVSSTQLRQRTTNG